LGPHAHVQAPRAPPVLRTTGRAPRPTLFPYTTLFRSEEGSVIEEDRSKGTIALQDTLTTVRDILEKIDPVQFGRVLGTLSQALDGSGRMPGSTVERLDRWVTAVDESIPDLGVLLTDFSNSFAALNESAPELVDVLSESVLTARTIADRRT